ncbi:MAG TPA: methyltransferase domain-containing protein [Thermoanaerobaculia bacterium]|jgi:predicted SAM-dependent methyltransferase
MPIRRLIRGLKRGSPQRFVRRLAAGVPRGVVTPLLSGNDLYVAHQSLWTFYAAFSARRKVLLSDDNAGAAAAAVASTARAHVTAVVPSKRHFDYASNHAGGENVEFARAPRGAHNVVVADLASIGTIETLLDSGLLLPYGVLILRMTPPENASPAGRSAVERVRRKFTAALSFGHFANVPLDLSSAPGGRARLRDFEFVQLAGEPVRENAVAVLHVFSNDSRWNHLRLHLGAGPLALDGWVNIDNQPYAGIDFLWDLSLGVPFRGAQFVFAEHFIEHLPFDDAGALLRTCRIALSPSGVLRLSTPNLDWVWRFGYHLGAWTCERDAVRDCFVMNRAFRGWGHQFLYNEVTLADALRRAGFATLKTAEYGQSAHPELTGLERHPRDFDEPGLPHVLVAEASGIAETVPSPYEDLIAEFRYDLSLV